MTMSACNYKMELWKEEKHMQVAYLNNINKILLPLEDANPFSMVWSPETQVTCKYLIIHF